MSRCAVCASPFGSALRAAFVCLLTGEAALADGPLGANGERITTSSYSIDLYQGPVSAGNRVIGLGGAYVAIAEVGGRGPVPMNRRVRATAYL